jgi:hypothetical protein
VNQPCDPSEATKKQFETATENLKALLEADAL